MSEKRKDNKGRVLKTGESQRADGRYEFKYTDQFGKRHSIYSWKLVATDKVPQGKREEICLREQEREIIRKIEDGINVNGGYITMNDQFEKWMNTKTKLAVTTSLNYRYAWEHWVKDTYIGSSYVNSIKKSDILGFYALLHKQGLKNRTIGVVHRVIYPTLQLAVDDDLIRKNPSEGCGEQYTTSEEKREALTIDEQKLFIDCVKNSGYYSRNLPLIVFLFGTGCRIGEALGLTWDCIDFTNNTIRIEKQLIHRSIDGKMVQMIQNPKTDSGIRTIPMFPSVREQLLVQKQNKYFISESSECNIDGHKNFVFVTNKGTLMQHHSVYCIIQRVCRDLKKKYPDFPEISAHILRHTFCTRMAEQGVNMKVLQTLMGHNDLKMIMNVYDHVQEERTKNEMLKIADIVNL